MNFKVNVLSLGRFKVPSWEVFWMDKFNAAESKGILPLTLNMVVARDGKNTVVINTGPSEGKIELLDKTWRQLFGEYAGLNVSQEERPKNALASIGVEPEDVDYVFVTPFQTYSIGNINMFPNAKICVSKKGWIDFHAPEYKNHPHDIREMCIPRKNLEYMIFEAWDRVRLLEDEDTVIEGIDTFWTGVHHRASIAVKIDSTQGKVITSDSFFYFENIEERWPIGINESMYEALTAYDRIKKEADLLVPLYDPKVYERYPNGIVAK